MRYTDDDAPDPADLVLDATLALHRLELLWPQLAAATVPNRERRRGAGPRSTLQRASALREFIRDRRAAFLATQARRSPGGPKPAAANVTAVSVRRDVADALARLADRMWTATAGRDHEWPVFDTTQVRLADLCRACDGTGYRARPPGWWPATREWPPRPRDLIGPVQLPACRRCHDGVITWTATISASDQLVYASISAIRMFLPECTTLDQVRPVLRVLERAETAVRAATGAGDDRRILPAPCPVCDSRGTLYADVTAVDRRAWVIRCSAPGCECTGRGCPCGRPNRLPGRRHLWPAAEWHRPGGLAELLGVDLPDVVDADGLPVPPVVAGPLCPGDDDGLCEHDTCSYLHRQGVMYAPAPPPEETHDAHHPDGRPDGRRDGHPQETVRVPAGVRAAGAR
ncbi:hypothetical protein [Dactylosporangium sp. CS-033363]|uniref:hypothetical protein n=1 Tax=Dactylosporangium sp. CS-033363 TaxID=3239935 RepID=UPI003D943B24